MIYKKINFSGDSITKESQVRISLMDENLPVLIIGFNRPDYFEDRIKQCLKLKLRIYLFVDKASTETNSKPNKEVIEIVEKYRDFVSAINISKLPMGPRNSVISSIRWFFGSENKGIILEDDIEICDEFVNFARKCLQEYESDSSISSISASRFQHPNDVEFKLQKSIFNSSWGWATWKNRWEEFEQSSANFPALILFKKGSKLNVISRFYWQLIFLDTYYQRIVTWDYIWLWHNFYYSKFSVVPSRNLAINHGFGTNATHTTFERLPTWLNQKIEKGVECELSTQIIQDMRYDNYINQKVHGVNLVNLSKHFLKRPFQYLFEMWILKRKSGSSKVATFDEFSV